MAITDIKVSGKVFTDAGTAVNGATVALLETGTSTEEASTTTNSSGEWSFTETSLDATYDIKITVGSSVRYILWSDEITVTGIDAASVKVRGVEGAAAPIYFFADQADDAGDSWRVQASASDTLAIGSDKASAGTIIDYLTITNGANAAASVTTILGQLTVGVNDTGADVKFFGATAGSYWLWDESADGVVQIGTLTVGVDDAGHDVKFFGDTASAYIMWDTSADKLLTAGGAVIDIVKDKLLIGSTAVTTTAAELNVLDNVTAGTVTASLGVVVDSNKDIGTFRNITLSGELDAATLDLSSSADIAGDLVLSGGADGALQFTNAGENSIKIPDNQASALIIEEADNAYITFVTTNSSEAITVAKATTFSSTISAATGSTIGNLTLANGSITDSGGALDFGNETLTTTGVITGGGFTIGSAAILEAELEILDGATVTTTELNLIDGGTSRDTNAVASGDGILINDAGTMHMTNVDTVSTYFSSHNVGGGNIVTTGALDSGSITSGFGTIDTGSSTITTTGLISGGSLDIDNVLINGTTIGHTDDTDLMTVADGVLTVAGEVDAATLDISGNVDIDGTTNLDAVDIDGNVQLDGMLTIGVDDAGHDFKAFGATAGAYMMWDQSEDKLIIDQSIDDAEALILRSSTDVAHGFTSGFVATDTETYFSVRKAISGSGDGTGGGAAILAFAGDTANDRVLNFFVGGGTATTTITTSGTGLVDYYIVEHDGSNGMQNITANGNVFSIRARVGGSTVARLIVDEDGDLYSVTSAQTFDQYDDAQMVRALDQVKGDVIRDKWDDYVTYNEQALIDADVLGGPISEGGMTNVTQLQRLHNGAIWQGYVRQQELQERVEELETKLLALEGAK